MPLLPPLSVGSDLVLCCAAKLFAVSLLAFGRPTGVPHSRTISARNPGPGRIAQRGFRSVALVWSRRIAIESMALTPIECTVHRVHTLAGHPSPSHEKVESLKISIEFAVFVSAFGSRFMNSLLTHSISFQLRL